MALLKEIPAIERPRERLELSGAESLSIAELIAIIIRTGTKEKSSVELAYEILKEFDDLDGLSTATTTELCKIKGIEKAKAISLLASIELGKRIASTIKEKKKIENALDVYNLLKMRMLNLAYEEVVVVYLNIKGEIIKIKKLSTGTTNKTLIEGKDVIRWALKYSSSHFILVHNHPSGDPTPSSNDKVLTETIEKQAKILGMTLIDHIVIGRGKYHSIYQNKTFSSC